MARPRQKLDRLGQAGQVAARLKSEPPGWRRECLLAVQLGLQGQLSLAQIAAATGRARSTIQQWFAVYRAGGVAALLQDGRADNPGAPGKLTAAATTGLAAGLQAGRWRTVPQLRAWLQAEHGIPMALSSLYNRLGKAGARLRVPRPSHVKNNPAAALAFRETLPAKLAALRLPPARPVRLWVQDEMRCGLHGFTRRVWGLPGHRPVAATQQVYEWGYLYGAVGVGLARTEFLLAGSVDLATERRFYRQVADSDPGTLHVLLQDGAGFHLRDGDGRLPANLRIVTLPPYSPELNPVEGLWDQLKDALCNRVFATLAELEAAIAGWLGGSGRTPAAAARSCSAGCATAQTLPPGTLYRLSEVDGISRRLHGSLTPHQIIRSKSFCRGLKKDFLLRNHGRIASYLVTQPDNHFLSGVANLKFACHDIGGVAGHKD